MRLRGAWKVLIAVSCLVVGGLAGTIPARAIDPLNGAWASKEPEITKNGSARPRFWFGAMAYDPTLKESILFIPSTEQNNPTKNDRSQTWAWNGQTSSWRRWCPTGCTQPPATYQTYYGPSWSASMAYDKVNHNLVLYIGATINDAGGYNGDDPQTWIWESASQTWSRYDPARKEPPGRSTSAMAYDEKLGKMVMFGGGTDTWTWDGSASGEKWQQQTAGPVPAFRSADSMAYDSERQVVTMFGGQDFTGTQTDATTWTWDGQWTQHPAPGPPSRSDAAMVFDRLGKKIILFGGERGGDQLGDTWAWDGAVWTEQVVTAQPAARANPAMSYDEVRDEGVLFGGYCKLNPNLSCDDTEGNHRYACEATGNGKAGYACFDDTWIWRSTPAGSVPPSPAPSPSPSPAPSPSPSPMQSEISPRISTIDPACGPQSGGTTVSITGAGLSKADAVYFGETLVKPSVVGDTRVEAVSPEHSTPETVPVTVGAAGVRARGSLSFAYPCSPVSSPGPAAPSDAQVIPRSAAQKPTSGGFTFASGGGPPATAPVSSGAPAGGFAPGAASGQTSIGASSSGANPGPGAASVASPVMQPASVPGAAADPQAIEPQAAPRYSMTASSRADPRTLPSALGPAFGSLLCLGFICVALARRFGAQTTAAAWRQAF